LLFLLNVIFVLITDREIKLKASLCLAGRGKTKFV